MGRVHESRVAAASQEAVRRGKTGRDLLPQSPDEIGHPTTELKGSAAEGLNLLVTGATGFLGRRALRALCTRGHRVVAIARNGAVLDRLDGLTWLELGPDGRGLDGLSG